MTQKILIFGKNGQVGSQLIKQFANKPAFAVTAVDIDEVDLTDNKACESAVLNNKPNWVINTSAHTAVDKAESEQELAHQLNATAPEIIAKACHQIGASMVHYSTDYVFDGSATEPYVETDAPNPQSVYGVTKLTGEQAVSLNLASAYILRTAWVFSREGKNFVNTMLNLAKDRDQLNVVNDQYGSPTLADDLASTTIAMIEQTINKPTNNRYGLYHATNTGVTSWSGFSEAIMAQSGNSHVTINPIPGSEYPTPAPRPDYSVLSNAKLKQQFDLELPTWQDALARCLS